MAAIALAAAWAREVSAQVTGALCIAIGHAEGPPFQAGGGDWRHLTALILHSGTAPGGGERGRPGLDCRRAQLWQSIHAPRWKAGFLPPHD